MDTHGIPFNIPQKLLAVWNNTTTKAIEDLKQGNNHLARCSIFQYTEAIHERQSAWLKTSNLSQLLQSKMSKYDLAAAVATCFIPSPCS